MDERHVFAQNECDEMSRDGLLPGYKSWGDLPAMITQGMDWQAVLSVSFYRRNPADPNRLQTMTGVRTGATTHDGVVSTITGAFPAAFQRPLLDSLDDCAPTRFPMVNIGGSGINPQEVAVAASFRPNPVALPGVDDPLPYLCHDILSRKLGLQHLTQRRLRDGSIGTISLSKVLVGFSYVDDEHVFESADPSEMQPVYEPLIMWGAAVMLDDAFRDVIPSTTERYGYLGWTDAATFSADVRSRDVLGLAPYVPAPESVQFCARGLCLATGSEVSQDPTLAGHLDPRVATRMFLEDLDRRRANQG